MSGIDGPARLRLDDVIRRLDYGPLDRGTMATIVAEQLSDGEFDALTQQQRKMLALARLGLSTKQVAEALDRESVTVRNTLADARKLLAIHTERGCAA